MYRKNCGTTTETKDLQNSDDKSKEKINNLKPLKNLLDFISSNTNKKSKVMGIILILLLLLIIGKVTIFKNNTENSSVIIFPDKNLEKVVRDAVKKPAGNIYKSDVDKITRLDSRYVEDGKPIKDISGLESLTNLTSLILIGNQISNIEPLKGLTSLTRLDLSENGISNIEPLKELTNLTMLDLSNNYINNIDALKGLTNLTRLCLNSNEISNINELKGLIKLTTLCLSDNKITDYSPTSSYYKNLSRDFTLP